MNHESVFTFCSGFAISGWILLVIAPRWKWIPKLVTPVIFPTVLALVYGYFLFPDILSPKVGFGTLDGVGRVFDNTNLLLAAWVHYLAFDLFIGSWEMRDSQKLGISYWVVLPCLILTFLLGPLGLFVYLLVRFLVKGRLTIDSAGA